MKNSFKVIFLVSFLLSGYLFATNPTPATALEITETGKVRVENQLVHKNNNTYDPLPVGTILMFSGQNWVDNVTIPGWYACTLETNGNKKIVGVLEIPNLENMFIMGTTPTDLYSQSPVRTGGKNTIEAKDLPKHAHEIDHDHGTITATTSSDTHNHTSYIYDHTTGTSRFPHSMGINYGYNGDEKPLGAATSSDTHNHTVSVKIPTFASNIAISKFIDDASNQDYTSGSVGEGMGAGEEHLMDNRPQYYTVIYIMKASNQ